MRSFEYNTPTHVVFGKDSVEKVGALVAEQGCKKVLIHYGGGSAKRSGLLDRVSQSLDASGVAYVMLGGVVPNPRLSLVREGIALVPQRRCRLYSGRRRRFCHRLLQGNRLRSRQSR